jgi:hypothetical protein
VLIAGLWGFAEATLFFLVPDIWLTAQAVRRGLKPALLACLAALAGALLGGLAMYGWGAADPEAARGMLGWVPAIDATMIARVQADLHAIGVPAIFLGPLLGVPYKIYAVETAAAGVGIATFLAVSIPARLIRFLVVSMVAWAFSAALAGRTTARFRLALLGGVWTAFYIAYITFFGI